MPWRATYDVKQVDCPACKTLIEPIAQIRAAKVAIDKHFGV